MKPTTNISLKKTAQLLILCTPFISGIHIQTAGATLYLHYIVSVVGIILSISTNPRNIYSPKKARTLFILTLILSASFTALSNNPIINSNMMQHTIVSFSKTILAFFLLQVFFSLYQSYNKSLEALFADYLKVSLFFCCVAILQETIYIATNINIPDILGLTYKNYGHYIGVPGLSLEPAFFACAILPATCYYISKSIKHGRPSKSLAITLIAVAASTSSLGILGIITCTILSLLSSRKSAIKPILVCSFLTLPLYGLVSSEFFQLRLNDTVNFVFNGDFYQSNGINLSTYSIGVNTAITVQSLLDNYGLGVGFGQYSSAFDNYISNYEIPGYRDNIPGRGSATSFLLRITTELGIIGLIAILFAFVKHTHIANPYNINHINIACTSTTLIILLRMGEYFSNGVIFVIAMLIISHREIKSRQRLN